MSTNSRNTRQSLPIALLRARERVMVPVRGMLAKTGLTEQKWRGLRVLHAVGEVELSRLAQEACLMLPSLTRMFKQMEEDGLVNRRSDPVDGRRSLAAITGDGREILTAYAQESQDILASFRKRLGEEKHKQLLELLDELQGS